MCLAAEDSDVARPFSVCDESEDWSSDGSEQDFDTNSSVVTATGTAIEMTCWVMRTRTEEIKRNSSCMSRYDMLDMFSRSQLGKYVLAIDDVVHGVS